MTMLARVRADYLFICEVTDVSPRRLWLLDALRNHSVIATGLMRRAARYRGIRRWVNRGLLLTLFSSDVAYGAKIGGPVFAPHPIGIVIGSGVVIQGRLKIYQHVTLGTDGLGYPEIGEDVILYTGCTVIGRGSIPNGRRINAGKVVVLSD